MIVLRSLNVALYHSGCVIAAGYHRYSDDAYYSVEGYSIGSI